LALLMSRYTEIVQRPRVIRLTIEDLAIELLRFVQAASLMVPQCKIEGLLDRKLRHTESAISSASLPIARCGRRANPLVRCQRQQRPLQGKMEEETVFQLRTHGGSFGFLVVETNYAKE
jgi:hypothetical protein